MRNFVVIDAHVFSIEGYRYLRLRWRVLKMDSEVKEKQRIIIQFCESVGHTPLQTKTLLDQSFGESAVKRTTVYTWYKRFHDGRTSPKDDQRPGQPSVRFRVVPYHQVRASWNEV